MYNSIHAYQSTESIEHQWKAFRFQSENGINVHIIKLVSIFFLQSLDMLSLNIEM